MSGPLPAAGEGHPEVRQQVAEHAAVRGLLRDPHDPKGHDPGVGVPHELAREPRSRPPTRRHDSGRVWCGRVRQALSVGLSEFAGSVP